MARLQPVLRPLLLSSLFAVGALAWRTALADDATVVELSLRDHRFSPTELRVPAGRPVVVNVRNEDSTPEEFDSKALKVEKVIAGKKSASVRIRSLDKGRYPFVGEYHEGTARGVVIAE